MTRSRGLALLAVSTLLAATATACGDDTGNDTGDEPTASDPTSATTTSDASSPSASPSTSDSPTATATPSDAGDPVPSPVINKAVRAAISAGFPALVPAGVPAGWTVERAAYTRKDAGTWSIDLTSPDGGAVRLVQNWAVDDLVTTALGGPGQPAGTVDLGEYGTGRWKVFTAGDTTAIATRIAQTTVVVTGPDQDTVVALAEQLLTAEDDGSGTGDG